MLAAMLALVPRQRRVELVGSMANAAKGLGLDMAVQNVDEGGESGFAISYTGGESGQGEISYEEAHSTIDRMAADLGSVSSLPRRILGLIFDAEAEAHGVPAEKVHLHEIGRPQALLNIAGIGLVCSELQSSGAGEIVASSIVTGKGIIAVSHGVVRVPAPAAKILLRGMKHSTGDDPGERATPSGVAAIKAMMSRQSDDVPTRFVSKGVGFGTKRFGGRLGHTTIFWV